MTCTVSGRLDSGRNALRHTLHRAIHATTTLLWVTMAGVFIPAHSEGLDKVRTFTQTNYPGFIQFVAKELGFFARNGIDPDLRYLPSGAPIVQAAAAKQWDIAMLGAPSAVIAGSAMGVVTIGVIYDEASQHKLIGRPDFVAKVKARPASLKGAKILVTTLSTGHYMTEACLHKFGLSSDDVSLIPSEQSATLSAFTAGQGDLAQLWPPFTSALLERGNVVLCDGQQAGLDIVTVWVATKDFATRHPASVVNWLKANGEAIVWINQDVARTTEMYRKFMKFTGQSFTESTLKDVVSFVMTAKTLPEQVRYMSSDGTAPAFILRDYDGIVKFFIRNGRMTEAPDLRPLADATFLLQASRANPTPASTK